VDLRAAQSPDSVSAAACSPKPEERNESGKISGVKVFGRQKSNDM